MKTWTPLIFLLTLLGSTITVQAGELVVIVNKDNPNAVTKAFVKQVYFGESRSWPAGGNVVVYDLPEGNATRAIFSNDVLGKSVSNMKALAAQNLFSGKAVPAKQLGSDEEVKKAVAENKNAIGYIKASSVDATVKVAVN